MQPLGYYGLNLSADTEKAIDNLKLHELIDLANDVTCDMTATHCIDNEEAPLITHEGKPISPDQLSDLQKLGLIRGLCDRIEIKLMEQAK